MKFFFLVVLALTLLPGCQPRQAASGQTNDSVLVKTASDTAAVLDLLALKTAGAFAKTQAVHVPADPVFHASKNYQAVPLPEVLARLPGYPPADPAAMQVVFECADGYKPSMPLPKLLSHHAYLALRDADAPAGQDWPTLKKGSETKTIAPFYVVYTDVPPDDETFKWPYNLVKIRLIAANDELALLHPAGVPERGYALFRTHCSTCHALNGVGGVMGPELNFPKNVTEYWQPGHLRSFVRNPPGYRHNVKMPPITAAQLSDADLENVLKYLAFMAGHKRKG